MEDLLIITIVTVLKLTYRVNSIKTKIKRKRKRQKTNKETSLTWLRNWSGININNSYIYTYSKHI